MSAKKVVIVVILGLAVSTQGLLFNREPKEVTYGKYGTFKEQPNVRWSIFIRRPSLPESPSTVGTTFHLFTRGGSLTVDDEDYTNLMGSDFDISRRTIFIIHGFNEGKDTWAVRMKDALLNQEDCNVILVDWSEGAKNQPNIDLLKSYLQAAGNTRLVGAQVAELIRFLISSDARSHEPEFYIVGFSLGAQTAGYAGSYLRNKAEMTLSRITGLDPANPFFRNADVNYRLDPSDAEYVDVIHTDMDVAGTDKATGHTDFYPNGGKSQPGCKSDRLGLDSLKNLACDHMRATEYYIATIEPKKDEPDCSWKAYPCGRYSDFEKRRCMTCNGECPTMGYLADKTKRTGEFYLDTNHQAPFCGSLPW
ncbi:inactive pancreatic lipase-related protein 1-like isoform X1 [Stylophora pistillata]|uniref:inactive pancreatic lipase-related protein 1-like isoform X1 n=1 Tax=Stylophora pistillata TaxID=50429 RepID=UPI000C04F4A0|nr:inactive pancreatic lipase-related protein 1-like isoform X1 [Stylophora pistillata]